MSNQGDRNEKVIEHPGYSARVKGKKRRRLRILVVLVLALLIAGAIYNSRTFHGYKLLTEQSHTDGDTGSYTAFGTGFIRYTGNGVQYIDGSRNTIWETAYEMKSPAVKVCRSKTAAIADMRGNQIYVFDKKGLIGSVTTTMPVQAFAVSEQGIVAAVVRNREQTKLILYSPDGTVLVEGRASFADTGYPLGVAISPNGQKVLASYISVGETILSRVIGYDFSNVNASEEERVILDETYPELLIPEVEFLDDRSGYALGNGKILFFNGSRKWKEDTVLEIEETILSVIADGDRIGIVTERADEEERYALGIYSTGGRKLRFMNFDEEYNSIYMKSGQVFLLNGTHCIVFSTGGQRLFDGEFDTDVSYMVPVMGIRKYLVAEDGRVELVRLTKEQP